MEISYLRFIGSLALVLILLVAVLWGLRRFGVGGMATRTGMRRRLGVVEAVAVDGRRRLVLVRRDDREHLLLVGGAGELVIECDIQRPADTAVAQVEEQGS